MHQKDCALKKVWVHIAIAEEKNKKFILMTTRGVNNRSGLMPNFGNQESLTDSR